MTTEATPTPEVAPVPEPAPVPEATPAVTPQEPDWLPGRLDRAKRSAVSETLKELGVEDLDAAKAAIEEAKRIKAEQMTEVERAQQAAEALTAKNAELEATLKARDMRDMRNKIAAETGLPEVLAAKLSGETEEELMAEAKEIIKALPPLSKGLPPAAGTVEKELPPDLVERNKVREAMGLPPLEK